MQGHVWMRGRECTVSGSKYIHWHEHNELKEVFNSTQEEVITGKHALYHCKYKYFLISCLNPKISSMTDVMIRLCHLVEGKQNMAQKDPFL